VVGDAELVERAVLNVLDNAVKWSPPGGRVEVRLHGGLLEVHDEGPGIAPEDRPYVFERFWRAESARSQRGSGLGLAIAWQVVASHGGTLAIDPAVGVGTRVVMCLPVEPWKDDDVGASAGAGEASRAVPDRFTSIVEG
jgi:two-component system sensor histidine kinase MprB